MGADYSFYVKNIKTHARAFLALNILAIGRVLSNRELSTVTYLFILSLFSFKALSSKNFHTLRKN